MNNLSRNRPLALVIGASGFIGSHLVEKLLSKNIQVVGIDNLSSGKKEYLENSFKDKNFIFLNQDADDPVNSEIPRLDYVVIAISEKNPGKYQSIINNLLEMSNIQKAKIILVSSANLYDADNSSYSSLQMAESRLAEISMKNKINARVLRITSVFGPRMNFRQKDPIIKLIKASLLNDLSEGVASLDFTTRALFVDDTTDLLLKTIMHGGTAQKIYDGAGVPIKISEIKQILLDPVWHESKGFLPTELPPWPTPNLNKTKRELNWSPKTPIVQALKETLIYFKNNDLKDLMIEEEVVIPPQAIDKPEETKVEEKIKKQTSFSVPQYNFKKAGDRLIGIFFALVIIFLLLFPFIKIGGGVMSANYHYQNSLNHLSKGELELSSKEASLSAKNMTGVTDDLKLVNFVGFLPPLLDAKNYLNLQISGLSDLILAHQEVVGGVNNIADVAEIISGGREGNINEKISLSEMMFADAKKRLDLNYAKNINQSSLVNLTKYINYGQTISSLFPYLIDINSQKNYLVVLVDEREIRSGGGVIKAFSEVTFDQGKLIKISSNIVGSLDDPAKGRIDAPSDLKIMLGITDWQVKDALYEADLPTSANTLSWFYNKQTGRRINGIILVNMEGLAKILALVGPVKISSDEEINANNLSAKINMGPESNQLGSKVLEDALNKVFFLSKNNWLNLAELLANLFENKDMTIFLSDLTPLSLIDSLGATGSFPRQANVQSGERNGFLAFIQTSLTPSLDASLIDYSLDLSSKIDEALIVSNNLSLNFTNNGSIRYKENLKIYLPAGSKLLKVMWGSSDVTKDVKAFSDYGRAGYSYNPLINPKEKKTLKLEYQDMDKAKFEGNNLKFNQLFFKQPGTNGGALNYTVSYPVGWRVQNQKVENNQVIINSDLSKNRNFEIDFRK